METNPPSNQCGGSLPAPTDAFAAHISHAPEYPAKLGPYRILGKLGSGGMGVVLAAIRDDDTMKKRVAIKLIKRGWDTDEIIRRFTIERQVLGALNHPNIARVIDAGAAEDGRPFFVMEFVDGMPIDKYCDFHRLTTEQRVRLFMKVCSAVQYAHQNLVVHRDIKPHNILVTQSGEPKLLDFGIAKLLNPDMQQIAVFTGLDLRLMTPEYASPEQVSGGPISTASDVYSLGVLLYELLTGVRPYHFRTRVEEEIRRVVMEVEPARPSTAVTQDAPALPIPPSGTEAPPTRPTTGTQVTGTLATRAQQRGTAVNTLRRELADDLDDIVLMAMRKVPRMRYASAQQLADDLARHLNGEPVLARPESAIYRLKKVVKRHKVAVGIAAAFLIVSAASAVVMGTLWARAERERVRAEGAEALAQREAASAKAGAQLAESLALQVLPEVARLGGSLGAQELIGRALKARVEQLPEDMKSSPQALRDQADALEALATAAFTTRGERRGSPDVARPLFEEALRLREILTQSENATSRDREALLLGKIKLADLLMNALGKTDQALALYAQAAREAEQLPPPSPTDQEPSPGRRLLAAALINAADALLVQGRDVEATGLITRSVSLREEMATRWPDDRYVQRDLSVGLSRQGRLAERANRWEDAVKVYQQALAIRRRLAALYPDEGQTKRDVVVASEALVRALLETGQFAAARELLVPALSQTNAAVADAGDDERAAWDQARLMLLTGRVLVREGRAKDAAQHFQNYSMKKLVEDRFPGQLPLLATAAEWAEASGDAQQAAGHADLALEEWKQADIWLDRLCKAMPDAAEFPPARDRVSAKIQGRARAGRP